MIHTQLKALKSLIVTAELHVVLLMYQKHQKQSKGEKDKCKIYEQFTPHELNKPLGNNFVKEDTHVLV